MILIVATVLLAGAAFVFYDASQELRVGTPWATDLCSMSSSLCRHPEWLLYAAIAAVVLFLAQRLAGAFR